MTQPIYTPKTIQLISQISAFTNTSADVMSDGTINWCIKHPTGHYHIEMDINNKEVNFVDYDADDKTYYAILCCVVRADYDQHDCYSGEPHSHSHEEEAQEEE